jgi:hypothetical protein
VHDERRVGEDGRDGPSSRSVVRTARLIYIAFMAGLATFASVVAFAPSPDAPGMAGSGPSIGFLQIIAGVLSVTMALPAMLFSGRAVRRSAGGPGLRPAERVQRYLAGKLFVAALIEGPGLIWGIIALLSGELLPLAGVAFSIFALGVVFPRPDELRDATGV